MVRALLGLLMTAAIAAPASAQTYPVSSLGASTAFGGGFVAPVPPGGVVSGHRRHIHVGDRGAIGAYGYGYAGGYLDAGDYDANRSFSPDKWNDWWHERPDRAFPRWMSNNQGCERIWWSGGGWRC